MMDDDSKTCTIGRDGHASLPINRDVLCVITGHQSQNGRNATVRLQAGDPANPNRHHPIPSSAKLVIEDVDGGPFVANVSLPLTVTDTHAGVRVAGSLHKKTLTANKRIYHANLLRVGLCGSFHA